MPEEIEWVTLYNPTTGGWHRVHNHPAVVQDFQDRGFETPEDSAARAEADAGQLRGQELEDALKDAGLSTSGKVAEKQARLAEHRAAHFDRGGELPATTTAVNDSGTAERVAAPEPTEPFDPLTLGEPTPTENNEEQV